MLAQHTQDPGLGHSGTEQKKQTNKQTKTLQHIFDEMLPFKRTIQVNARSLEWILCFEDFWANC
jgi:hypothetical protein